jgi:hypothetical protein
MDDAENQPPWMHGGAGANLASTRAHAHAVPGAVVPNSQVGVFGRHDRGLRGTMKIRA